VTSNDRADAGVVAIDVVGRRRDVRPWTSSSPDISGIVAIGVADEMDAEALDQLSADTLV
jgi:hypothetical protein